MNALMIMALREPWIVDDGTQLRWSGDGRDGRERRDDDIRDDGAPITWLWRRRSIVTRECRMESLTLMICVAHLDWM